MTIEFEIIGTHFHHNRGQFIFARILDSSINFEVTEETTFGGIPVYHYIDMPRMLDENNKPRLDIFTFRPIKPLEKGDFTKGQIVELLIP